MLSQVQTQKKWRKYFKSFGVSQNVFFLIILFILGTTYNRTIMTINRMNRIDNVYYTLVSYLKTCARQNTRECYIHLYVTEIDFLLLAVFRPYSGNFVNSLSQKFCNVLIIFTLNIVLISNFFKCNFLFCSFWNYKFSFSTLILSLTIISKAPHFII